eukprot:TRINITY_DN111678_c0_g1_i1.p1 TRINITY_DN111678_c0_g1~~TRINITY_DN111678_c0_g1_i1.p1  ORF type:complete len:458 (-),score=111.06 TRINITY_DN111678_c0_g1_i1:590-1921(-)
MKASVTCLLTSLGAAVATASSSEADGAAVGNSVAAAWAAAESGVDSTGRTWKRTRRNEILELPGLEKMAHAQPMPHEYVDLAQLPPEFDWGRVRDRSFLTKVMNQHVPQYCGSCWAQAATSALADRVKIARNARGTDILLSVQYILNCGNSANNHSGGTCLGGSSAGAYQFIKAVGHIPFETCQPYEACSYDSVDGICPHGRYQCNALNTCRTCMPVMYQIKEEHHAEGPPLMGSKCVGMMDFPKVRVAEHGIVRGQNQMLAELYTRGPMACNVNADPLEDYTGGIIPHKGVLGNVDHVVSVVGFGIGKSSKDDKNKYWRVRNSWGEYWGEMGFFRIDRGHNELLIESECAWATPHSWTERNEACLFDGANCERMQYYEDPAIHGDPEAKIKIGMLTAAVESAVDTVAEAATADLASVASGLGLSDKSAQPTGESEKYEILVS